MLCLAHVKFSSQTFANVCTCVCHQTIILALDAMSGYSNSFLIHSRSFPNSCLAEPENEKFWFGRYNHINCGFQYHYRKPHNIEHEANWKIREDNNKPIAKTMSPMQKFLDNLDHFWCSSKAWINSILHLL